MKISGDSAWKRQESARNPGALLKGQCTGSCSQTLIWGSGRGKVTQSTQESYREDLCGVTQGEIWRVPPCPTLPSDPIFLEWALLFLQHQPGESTTPVLQLLATPPPCQAGVLHKGLPAPSNRDVWCTVFLEKLWWRLRQSLSYVTLERGYYSPLQSCTPYAHPLHLVTLLTCTFYSWCPHPAGSVLQGDWSAEQSSDRCCCCCVCTSFSFFFY